MKHKNLNYKLSASLSTNVDHHLYKLVDDLINDFLYDKLRSTQDRFFFMNLYGPMNAKTYKNIRNQVNIPIKLQSLIQSQ